MYYAPSGLGGGLPLQLRHFPLSLRPYIKRMTIQASLHFLNSTPRVYVLPHDCPDLRSIAGLATFPGYQTAWEQIPNDKYRTLFNEQGEMAYLVKTDSHGTTDALRSIGRKLTFRERERLLPQLSLHWQGGSQERLAAFANGFFLGTYTQGQWKTEAPQHPLRQADSQLQLVGEQAEGQATILHKAYLQADTQMRCMDLLNAPANKKRPQDLADWAIASGQRFGYQVDVLDKAGCEAEGLHALLAVNRGSEDPPRFIIQTYKGTAAPEQPSILVGKGVTFDTGGISIKPSTNLHLMKSDMGGAAAVLGTIEAAARLQLPLHLVGLVPATDNCVDALSYKPSDVIASHSGKTIEIIDTDAEGRLLLADALSYATTHYQPTTLIDLATLTGSAVRTFGYECAALFTQNDELCAALRRAGDESDERVWPLPMWEAYQANLKSDVADLKHFSGKPISGAIDAAVFLSNFTNEHPRYAHLDIAGVAMKASPYASDRMATGYGIGLLLAFLHPS